MWAFLAVVDRKCFNLPRIYRKCSTIFFWLSSSLKLFLNWLLSKDLFQTKINQPPFLFLTPLYSSVNISWFHCPPNHEDYCLPER